MHFIFMQLILIVVPQMSKAVLWVPLSNTSSLIQALQRHFQPSVINSVVAALIKIRGGTLKGRRKEAAPQTSSDHWDVSEK